MSLPFGLGLIAAGVQGRRRRDHRGGLMDTCLQHATPAAVRPSLPAGARSGFRTRRSAQPSAHLLAGLNISLSQKLTSHDRPIGTHSRAQRVDSNGPSRAAPATSPRLQHPLDTPGCSADDYGSEVVALRCIQAAGAANSAQNMAIHTTVLEAQRPQKLLRSPASLQSRSSGAVQHGVANFSRGASRVSAVLASGRHYASAGRRGSQKSIQGTRFRRQVRSARYGSGTVVKCRVMTLTRRGELPGLLEARLYRALGPRRVWCRLARGAGARH
jgi:hypothetical protein